MKIVLTGGPSAGKTTIAAAIQRELAPFVQVVPEAASILFQGGFPRGVDTATTKFAQKAIYHVQKELEANAVYRNPKSLILCDRGSLDGLAYWPGDSKSFFTSVYSNLKKELQRYDWVIHLDTAPASHYETTNPIRIENYDTAKKVNQKIKKAWGLHPKRIVIQNNSLFFTKIHQALDIINAIRIGAKFSEVEKLHKAIIENQITRLRSEHHK